MIFNLNNQTFAPFGHVFTHNERIHLKLKHSYIKNYSEPVPFMKAKSNQIYMNNLDAPTVLMIAQDSPENPTAYLLDKPILLDPDIWFSIVSLTGHSTVRIAHDDLEFITYPGTKIMEENLLLDIPRIYTAFYQEKEKGFHFRGERHSFWELACVDRGTLHSVVEGEETLLQPGELVFYGTDQYHAQYADPDTAAKFYSICFDFYMPDSEFLLGRIYLMEADDMLLLKSAVNEIGQNYLFAEDMAACRLKELIIRIIRRNSDSMGEIARFNLNSENRIIRQACRFVEDNMSRQITVAEMAEHVSVSPSYLAVLFRKYKKITPIAYVTSTKLKRGKELIREGEYSITQISDLLGYSSVHYFSRLFKKKFGISPSTYAASL